MKFFSVPADFKISTLDQYEQLNSFYEDSKVIETYGQVTVGNVWGSGRAGDLIPKVDLNQLKDYVQYSKSKRIDFNYTLNATCLSNQEFSLEGIKKLMSFLQQLYEAGVEQLTLALPSLIEIVKMSKYNFKIKASTLCQITNANKAKSFVKMGIDRIVVDESINRDFETLKRIKNVINQPIELIVNVICHKNCIYRSFHQNQVSHNLNFNEASVTYYSHRCMMKRVEQVSNIMRLNWIRPEDLHYYSDIGINHFKIQGRQAAINGDIFRTVKSYAEESYDGNLMELLDAFAPTNSFAVYVDNKKLDGFIQPFVKHADFCRSDCAVCGYCESFINKSADYEKIKEINEMAGKFYKNVDQLKSLVCQVNNENSLDIKKVKDSSGKFNLDEEFQFN